MRIACVTSRLVPSEALDRAYKLVNILRHESILYPSSNKFKIVFAGAINTPNKTPLEKEIANLFKEKLKYSIRTKYEKTETYRFSVRKYHYNSKKLSTRNLRDMVTIAATIYDSKLLIVATNENKKGRAAFALRLASALYLPHIDLSNPNSEIKLNKVQKQLEKYDDYKLKLEKRKENQLIQKATLTADKIIKGMHLHIDFVGDDESLTRGFLVEQLLAGKEVVTNFVLCRYAHAGAEVLALITEEGIVQTTIPIEKLRENRNV
jgi:hypothetical protein